MPSAQRMNTRESKPSITYSHGPSHSAKLGTPQAPIARRNLIRSALTRRNILLSSILVLGLLLYSKAFTKSFSGGGFELDIAGLEPWGYCVGNPVAGRVRNSVAGFDFDYDIDDDEDGDGDGDFDGLVLDGESFWKDLRRGEEVEGLKGASGVAGGGLEHIQKREFNGELENGDENGNKDDEEGKGENPEDPQKQKSGSKMDISTGDNILREHKSNQPKDGDEAYNELGNASEEPTPIPTIPIQEKSNPNNHQQNLDFPPKNSLRIQSPIVNWGLGRISHRVAGANEYVYDESAGEDTWAYIMDTGVFGDHVQFDNGRAKHKGFNAVEKGDTEDRNGHGTAIAGIIAGSRDGVSKKANIIPVKILNDQGGGRISQVIDGIQWAYNDAQANGRLGKSLLHFSIGAGYSDVLNDAVTSAIKGGLMVVIAAGKSNSDISNFSPQSAPGALVVGSSTALDTRAPFSNYGASVRIFAPGISITTPTIGSSNNETIVLDGTNASAAFVSGMVLYFMRLFHESEEVNSPAKMIEKIVELGTPGKGEDGFGRGVRILYNGSGR